MPEVRLTVSTIGLKTGDVVSVSDETASALVAARQGVIVPGVELGLEIDLGTIAGVLEQVGDDKVKASAALSAEQEKGDNARVTLVDKLKAILED